MLNDITDPVMETLTDGSIVNRVVLLAGVVLILYGAVEILMVYMDIWNQLIKGEGYDPLKPVLRSFLGVIVGLVAVIFGVVLDFSWHPEEGH